MAKPKISAWCRRQTTNGVRKAEARVALKRYQLACEATVQPFLNAPTEERKLAAIEAINEFMSLYQRWVEPYLGEILSVETVEAPHASNHPMDTLRSFLYSPTIINQEITVKAIESYTAL